jgi:hypothetical protein
VANFWSICTTSELISRIVFCVTGRTRTFSDIDRLGVFESKSSHCPCAIKPFPFPSLNVAFMTASGIYALSHVEAHSCLDA